MATVPTRELMRGTVLGGLGLVAWSLAEYVRVRRGQSPNGRWWGRDLNALDRSAREVLRWSCPARADRLSDLLAYGVAPAACAWALRRADESLLEVTMRDGFAVTEAAVVAGLANQVTKQLAMRERPFADGIPRKVPLPDRYGSFFSGHASSVAVLCASTAFRRVLGGHPSKRLWILPAIPFAVAYLRVAADKHYLTDVLAGLAIGLAVALISTWTRPVQAMLQPALDAAPPGPMAEAAQLVVEGAPAVQ